MILGLNFSNIWDVIVSILAFVFALGLIIIIHEGGHFFFARRANILCREYAFGMGPLLWKKKKGETLYSIRALPIGGFCAIAGEEVEADPLKENKKVKLVIEDGVIKKIIIDDKNNLFDTLKEVQVLEYDLFDANDTGKLYMKVLQDDVEVEYSVDPQAYYVFSKPVKNEQLTKEQKITKYTEEIQIAPHNRTLNSKKKRQRAMVMFGGPLMNFVLAIVVFFIASLMLGFSDTSSTKLGPVDEPLDGESATPAYLAGLKEGDVILELSVDGYSSGLLEDWSDLTDFMNEYRNNKNYSGAITVKYSTMESGNKVEKTTEITPMVVIYSISMIQDINDTENVRIGGLNSQSLAYAGGLREGDIILGIKYSSDEEYVSVSTWKDVYNIFTENIAGDLMTLKVQRGTETVECEVDPYSKELFDDTQNVSTTAMLLGVSPQTKFNLGKSLIYPFTEFWASLKNMALTLKHLFTGNVGIQNLSGPVGIFTLTSDAAKQGFGTLLNFIGFLSVNVGFMNLLPIPALDGGRLIFLAYEAITKKRPNEKVETALITITMLLLFGLIIFVSFNDILRLFK